MAEDNIETSATTDTGSGAESTSAQTGSTDTTDAAQASTETTTATATAGKETVVDAKVDPKAKVEATWPEDWQDRLSAGDKKKLEQIKRYSTPQALADALLETKAKLRSGGFKEPLPEKPTPEQLANWRKENGIPEKPEDYKIEMEGGYVVGEDEKPMIDQYIKMMHESNLPPALVNKNLNAYYALKEQQEQAIFNKNEEAKNQTVEMLRQEWGSKYQGNINTIVGFLNNRFGDSAGKVLQAFGTDNVAIMNDPKVLSGLLQIATEIDPAATVTNPSNNGSIQSINEEIAAIEARMRNDRTNYFKDQAAQDRYLTLITARDNIKKAG
jgi:hypothetical protein